MSRILDVLDFPLRGQRLIEASAGTGKTYTITGLYLRLLLGHGTDATGFGLPLPVDRILVVTFTEAATAELRGRILARIRAARQAFEAGHSQDPLLQSLLEAVADRPLATRLLLTAERQMDEAAIHTIHGFCQRMLKQNAFESGSLFETEFVSDDERLHVEAVADFWRHRCYGLALPLARAVRDSWKTPQALLRTLRPHLATPELRCLGGEGSLEARHAEILGRIEAVKRQWRAAAGELDALIRDSGVDKRSYSSRNLPNWLAQVGDWAATSTEDYALPEKLKCFSQAELSAKTKKGAPPHHPLFAAIDALLAAPLGIQDVLLRQALTEVRQRLRQAKLRRQLLGFDDLLSGLDLALGGPAAEPLAARIREQYPVAMIDEFQDTDPQQYRIFTRLYGGAADGCGLYLIGDPKQAIYGFRGADIFTYIQAKRQVVDHYTLETNYRSTHALVAAVNGLFAQASAPFIYQADIPFQPVQANGKKEAFCLAGKPVAPLQWYLADTPGGSGAGEKRLSLGAYRQQMACAAAAQVHAWLCAAQAGSARIGSQPLKPGDIAILVRTGSEAALVRQALRECGIASVYLSSRESVFATQEARDLALLLHACLNPTDDSSLRRAMGSALVGWSAEQLVALNQQEALWEQAVERLRHCAELWRQKGVLPMLRHFLFLHAIPARLLSEADGERRLTDLLHLGELLQQAAAELSGEPALLRWLNEHCRAPNGNADEQQLRLESERKLVQVVTIHKSKGLQYPLVLLPFISGFRPTDQAKYHAEEGLWLDLAYSAESLALADEERLAEDLRLLYVALTRGIYTTWLGMAALTRPGAGKGPFKAPKGALEAARSALDYLLPLAADQPLTARLAALQALVPGCEVAAPLPWPEQPYQEPGRAVPAPRALRFEQPLQRDWRVSSYSALVAGLGHGTPRREPASEPQPGEAPEPRLDAFGFPRGARPGTLLHSLFEGLDFTRAAGDSLSAWIASRLEGVKLTADWQAEPWLPVLVEWVGQVLDAELAPGLRLRQLAPGRCLPELEFFLPLAPLAAPRLNALLAQHDPLSAAAAPLAFARVQGMLKGFMDLVFEHQGRFYVLDYKSNHLGDAPACYGREALVEAMLQHRYDVQYQLYSLALHRYLASRVPDYDYERHFGGVFYLFLRGMQAGTAAAVYAARPRRAHIEALDRLFAGQEAVATSQGVSPC